MAMACGIHEAGRLLRESSRALGRDPAVLLEEAFLGIGPMGALLDAFVEEPDGDGWRSVVPREAMDWIRGYVPVLAGDLEDGVLTRIRDEVAAGLREGWTNEVLVARLGEVQSFARHRLEAIARTESMRAYNLGGLISASAAEGVAGFEFSAVLDDRTSSACQARDGLRLRLGDPRLAVNTPPLHPNCRSVLIPLFEEEVGQGWQGDHGNADALAVSHPSRQRPEDAVAVRKVLEGASEVGPRRKARRREETPVPEKAKIQLPIIADPQRRTWAEGVLEDAPEEVRRIVEREAPTVQYGEYGHKSYAQGKNRMNVGSLAHNDAGNYAHVFFHEFGHIVDARSAKIGLDFSAEPGSLFGKAYAEDRARFLGRARPERDETITAMRLVTDRGSKWYKDREVSDIVCSMTKGRLSGGWGHSVNYYKHPGHGEAEVFANLFALKAQRKEEAVEVVRSLFPNVVRAFEDFLLQGGGA